MWTIYALVDPRTNQIRYVGQTQNHPEIRLAGHIEKDDGNKAKRDWIGDLQRLGVKPVVVALEYAATLDDALVIEHFWIKRGRHAEWPLLNMSRNPESYRRNNPARVVNKSVVEPAADGCVLEKSVTNHQISYAGRWEKVVSAWFEKHPECLDGQVSGISDLARYMAASDGQPQNWHNYKSAAHRIFHDYRKAQRLGTDTTGGAL